MIRHNPPAKLPPRQLVGLRPQDAARKEGDAAAARAELERRTAAHRSELERLVATYGTELTRFLADRDHKRAERAKLNELLADAAAPWWRRLFGRRP